jgi:hypothetical protein
MEGYTGRQQSGHKPKNYGGYKDRWIDTDGYTDRQQGDIISLVHFFFQNKESRLTRNPSFSALSQTMRNEH